MSTTGQPTLHDLIAGVFQTATTKMASAAEKQEDKQVSSAPSIQKEEAEKATSTSPDYIEKLASAVDYISANFSSVEPAQKGLIATALEKVGKAGAGLGPGALQVSKSIGGQQSYKKDHPATEDPSKSQASTPMTDGENGSGKTQLSNNMGKAPGQGSGSVPKAEYPEKGPLVNLGKSKLAEAVAKVTGTPSGDVASQVKEHILMKLAGEDVAPANISAKASANPLAGKGQLTTTQAGQASPHQAGDPTSGFGNQARKLIASNTAAINATKGGAKGPVKTQLKQVLEEPALSSKTDSTLQQNLRNTGKAGVKIAAMQSLLEKVAAAGCTCEGKGECAYDKLQQAIEANGVKVANAMLGGGGMSMSGMSGATPQPMSAGGMTAMSGSGEGADGCVCGNTGECRVCKLKAALAAKAGAPAGAGEQGSVPQGQ